LSAAKIQEKEKNEKGTIEKKKKIK